MILFWQYNGVAPWNKIVDWAQANLTDTHWSANYETFTFHNARDYTLFMLRWG